MNRRNIEVLEIIKTIEDRLGGTAKFFLANLDSDGFSHYFKIKWNGKTIIKGEEIEVGFEHVFSPTDIERLTYSKNMAFLFIGAFQQWKEKKEML